MSKKALFLPGLGATGLVWEELFHLLPFEKSVFVLDGESSRKAMAEAVVKEIAGPSILVGHSMGGWVAQEVAASTPELVEALVLISSWSKQEEEAYHQLQLAYAAATSGHLEAMLQNHLQRLVHPKRLQDELFMRHVAEIHTAHTPQTLLKQMGAMLQDFDVSSLIPQIRCPVLLIHGKQDALFDYQSLEKSWPNKRLALLEECGHLPPVESPKEVASLILDFVP